MLISAQAGAVIVVGSGGAAAPREAPKPPLAAAAASLDLIGGTISAIDPVKKTMIVSGATLTLHPTRLRIFGANGSAGSERDLQPGLRVRFALEPGAGEARRVELVYLEGGQ